MSSHVVLGPLPCRGCGHIVRWVRADERLVIIDVEERAPHRCRGRLRVVA